jgi:oligopeptide transport system ATP-binding protein
VDPLLEVRNLKVQFTTMEGVVHAVNGVSFQLETGKTLGVVGESGCGKSVTMLSVIRLIQEPPGRITEGEVLFQGHDLLKLPKSSMHEIRGAQIAMVFQDPMTSLNPVLTIGHQISEALVVHTGIGKEEAYKKTIELLEMVGIPLANERYKDYPHQFSGGMRQRVMIAMSLSCKPDILIADEPTTALDVTIQAQIVELTKKLQTQFGMAVIWITHDLGVVAEIADKMNVMYAGYIVEEADVYEMYENPRHPYTLSLLKSLPRVDRKKHNRLANIQGSPPDCIHMPPGCPFKPRCGFGMERCVEENPVLTTVAEGHRIACWVDVTTGRTR